MHAGACMPACMVCQCMHVCIHVCMYVCTQVQHACMHICMHVYMYARACVSVYLGIGAIWSGRAQTLSYIIGMQKNVQACIC